MTIGLILPLTANQSSWTLSSVERLAQRTHSTRPSTVNVKRSTNYVPTPYGIIQNATKGDASFKSDQKGLNVFSPFVH
ncbi:hypothetical protein AMECASPLE_037003 [Ameca splendens]|uniref:Uncharacterized protein n=1 Tax=Ameca splendens TaxID=208324 RepID=A0ABV0XKV2_9TELE